MKGDFKLSKDNIGDRLSVKTLDGFNLQGTVKSVSDTLIEVRDIESKNVFTIFNFEIKELEINGKVNQPIKPKECLQHSIKIEESMKYEHPVFGSLICKETQLNYLKVTDIDIEKLMEITDENDVYKCRFLYINAMNNNNNIYKKAMRYVSMHRVVGISFYCNEDFLNDKKTPMKTDEIIYKYLTISVPHLDIVIDIGRLNGQEFRLSCEEISLMLTSEIVVKLVNVGQLVTNAIASVLQTEMRNFIDIQIMHYGLHNIRLATEFKEGFSYGKLVKLLYNVEFKSGNKTYYTSDDVIHKMAFNGHFLVPLFELMTCRLIEPVKLISERISRLHSDNWNSNEMLSDLNINDIPNSIDYEILPRLSQFWIYQDNSVALQAKKLIDNEMQHEKQAVIAGGVQDVVEIKKNLVHAEEMVNKTNVNHYYEEISDTDEGDDSNNCNMAQQQHKSPWRGDSCWNKREIDNSQWEPVAELKQDTPEKIITNQEEKPKVINYVISQKIGIGRGRGTKAIKSNKSVENKICNQSLESNASSSAPSIELARSEGIFEGHNFSTSTKYPDPGKLHYDDQKCRPMELKSPGSATSKESPIDVFAKGRGVSNRRKNQLSMSSSADNGRCLSLSNANQEPDEESAEYCELSVRHWNKNSGKSGKLRFDEIADENVSSIPVCNQAMGIMWNAFGMKTAQETDELYAEYGLSDD